MGVLQTAHPVIGHLDSQVLFIQFIPATRHIFHGKLTGDQLFFNLISNHNVQRVGKFVGFCPDETGLGLVDCPIEHFFVYILELLREKRFHFREDGMDKAAAPADEVFIEPALAFVNAHGHAAAKDGGVVLIVRVQFIQGVTALMNHGIHAGCQAVFIVMGGNAHILIVKVRGKGMLRLRNAAVVTVQAHDLHQIV